MTILRHREPMNSHLLNWKCLLRRSYFARADSHVVLLGVPRNDEVLGLPRNGESILFGLRWYRFKAHLLLTLQRNR